MKSRDDDIKYRITQVEEFVEKVRKYEKIYILGSGWIAKLYYYWITYKCDVKNKIISIVQTEEKLQLDWMNVALIDKKTYAKNKEESLSIVSLKEKEAEEYLANFMQDVYMDVIYLSETLKNEIDIHFMKEFPDEYEKEILIGRKKQLDEQIHGLVKSKISELTKENNGRFQTIEIETINRCNGTCGFCPINRNDDTREYKKMSEILFESIIDQLSEMSYDGRIGLFSNNEPLLDKRIIKFAEYTAQNLPNAYKTIFTNGTLLDLSKFKELINYLDLLCIDIYYDERIEDEVSEDLWEVMKYCLKNKVLQKKTMVQFISRTAIRNNRGGLSKNRKEKYLVQAGCILPSIQMVIRPDGKLSLCCNDATGKNTIGDVSESTLLEVWNSDIYKALRNKIGETRQNYEFCKECDNYASLNSFGNVVFTERQMRDAWIKVRELLEKGSSV